MKRTLGAVSFSLAAMLVASCSSVAGDSGTAGDETSGSSSASGESAATAPTSTSTAGMTGPAQTTSGEDGPSATTEPPSPGDTSTGDSVGFITPDTGNVSDTNGEPQPLGGMCNAPQDCVSEFCYIVPQLGGLCSECLVDKDCGMGTCSLSLDMGFAFCAPGNQGDGCNTDEGCIGELVCGEVIDAGGIINTSFCSECRTTDDCDNGDLCVPEYAMTTLGGSLVCSAPGSVPNGSGCFTEEATACTSGFCGDVDILGFLQIGVCGECVADDDCPIADQTCVPGEVGGGGLVGATCQ